VSEMISVLTRSFFWANKKVCRLRPCDGAISRKIDKAVVEVGRRDVRRYICSSTGVQF
jgi:hypothetical protein